MNPYSFYTHDAVAPGTWQFCEGYAGRRLPMLLAAGSERALLIDAGLGAVGELREAVEAVIGTDLPVTCACTCGLPTHIGGAGLFGTALLAPADAPLAASFGLDETVRRSILADLTGGIPAIADYCAAHYRTAEGTAFAPLADGTVFDLGGVTVTAIALPGHTPGSTVFYCPQQNWLFAGGAISQHLSLKRCGRAEMLAYKSALERLLYALPEEIRIYTDSDLLPLTRHEAWQSVRAIEEIAAGRTRSDIPGESAYTVSRNRPEMRCHFAGNCSVAYNAEALGVPRAEPEAFVFYSHEYAAPRVAVVTENNARASALTLGLVLGDECALLIDTGMGMNGQLRGYIESLAGARHIIAASTHGNIDHIGGSISFEDRRLNRRDWPEIGRATGTPRRFIDIKNFCRGNEEAVAYCSGHYVPNENTEFTDIEAGEVFDLGGIRVEVLYSAGHTPGHLSYYLPAEHILFCGDSLSQGVLLRRLTGRELALYADNMQALRDYIAPDTRLYWGHGSLALGVADIDRVIAACREAAAGKNDGDPPCNVLRPDKPGGLRYNHFYGNMHIIYEPGIRDREGDTVTHRFADFHKV